MSCDPPPSAHGGLIASANTRTLPVGILRLLVLGSALGLSMATLPYQGVHAASHSNSSHLVTDRRWCINTPGPSPLCGGTLEVRVLRGLSKFPTRSKLQFSTVVLA